MPAFGAYTGGLSIRDAAFAKDLPRAGPDGACARRQQAARHRRVALLLRVLLILSRLRGRDERSSLLGRRALREAGGGNLSTSTLAEAPHPQPSAASGEGADFPLVGFYAAFACTASQNSARRSASRSVAALALGEATSAASVRSIGLKLSLAVSMR